jgi:hypothetical protein
MAAQLRDRSDISRLISISPQGKVFGHLPDADFAVVRGRRDERIVEGGPVGVEDGSSVAAEERKLVGSSAALIDGNDSKGAATAGFPVDGDVFGVGLDQVCVPGVLGDAKVVIALLLYDSKYM